MTMKSPSDLKPHIVREWAVILWDHGYPIKDICKALDRSLNTIRYHLKLEGRLGSYGRVGRPKDTEMNNNYMLVGPYIPKALRGRLKERCVSKPKRIYRL